MMNGCRKENPKYKKIDSYENAGMKYRLLESHSYYSKQFGKFVHLKAGMLSDGATGARDLPKSWSWWVHDKLCIDSKWADGSPCSALDASSVLYDILDEEGHNIRKFTWKWITFLFGSWRIKSRVGWM